MLNDKWKTTFYIRMSIGEYSTEQRRIITWFISITKNRIWGSFIQINLCTYILHILSLLFLMRSKMKVRGMDRWEREKKQREKVLSTSNNSNRGEKKQPWITSTMKDSWKNIQIIIINKWQQKEKKIIKYVHKYSFGTCKHGENLVGCSTDNGTKFYIHLILLVAMMICVWCDGLGYACLYIERERKV